MRALLQRVREARVDVDGVTVGACGHGLLIFLGVGTPDTDENARKLWKKIHGLRIFSDENGKTNLSLANIKGEVLIVSQFTLMADCRRGMRPSFSGAAPAAQAEHLYDLFCDMAQKDVCHVGRGVFGADMQVSLVNDGPFTICLDL